MFYLVLVYAVRPSVYTMDSIEHRLYIRTIIDVYANVCCVRTKTSLNHCFFTVHECNFISFFVKSFQVRCEKRSKWKTDIYSTRLSIVFLESIVFLAVGCDWHALSNPMAND